MPTTIAKSFGVETVDVLTGFKFIAEDQNYEADASKISYSVSKKVTDI